ncbi:MAG: NUDIX hydrolase [bacterium]|nr:NUDIX hydrolase [bacterium]
MKSQELKKLTWKKLSSKVVYESPWLTTIEDSVIQPNGKKGIYSVVERKPANFIIPYDSKTDSIYLLKEFRYPLQKEIWNIPAGAIEKGETELGSAKKELFQETGIKARKWKKLGKVYSSPGHLRSHLNVYVATNLNFSQLGLDKLEGDESILEIKSFKISTIKKMMAENKIVCGPTLASLGIFFAK